MDKYKCFSELIEAEKEGIAFEVSIVDIESSQTVIVAPHGGGIEPGTSEIAREIANDDLSLAIFEGKKSSGNSTLHLTSANFDEPRCLSLIKKKDFVISIHGEGSNSAIVFLGGKDELERQIDLFNPPKINEMEKILKNLRNKLKKEAKDKGWEVAD